MDLAHRSLCLLFTPELCAGDPWQTLETALQAGMPLVQWRVKQPNRTALERCLAKCAAHGVPVIINDDVELAVEVGAAGAHVGQNDMPAAIARVHLRDEQCLGVSTHDLAQATAAVAAGADNLGLGPCFPTATKGYDTGLSDAALGAVRAAIQVPIFAIGGITADNLSRLTGLGFGHFAVSSAVLAADHPGRVVENMLATIAGTQRP